MADEPDFLKFDYVEEEVNKADEEVANKQDEKPEIINEPDEIQTEVDSDPYESEARKHGWKPLEEFDGDTSNWRDAKNWLDRKSFFDRIGNQNKKIKELETALRDLAGHSKKIAEVERARILNGLKNEKRAALENQDIDRVMEIDEQLEVARNTPVEPPVNIPEADPTEDPDYVAFAERNAWYERDQDLRETADALALKFVMQAKNEGKNLTKDEVYNFVERKMQAFIKTEKEVHNPVTNTNVRANTGASAQRRSRHSYNNLNADQKRICDRFVRLGLYPNNQAYVDELVKLGELA